MVASGSRNYAFIGYLGDTLPDNYELLLNALHTPWVESPVHSPDGEHAKPHIHFLVMYSGPRKLTTVREELKEVAANGFVVPVQNVQGYERYLVHLDDPEKEQFPEGFRAIKCHCGADVSRAFAATAGQHSDNLRSILADIAEYGITNFADYVDYLLLAGKDDLLSTVTDKYTHFLDAYFRSKYYQRAECRMIERQNEYFNRTAFSCGEGCNSLD